MPWLLILNPEIPTRNFKRHYAIMEVQIASDSFIW